MRHYIKDTKEGKRLVNTQVCSECGRQLAVYIDMRDRREYVACSGQVHEGIAREYQPPIEDYQSSIMKEIKLEKEHGREASTALATIPKQGQLTESQAMSVLKLIYPQATAVEIQRCAIFCHDFGLHPLANEVYLIPFKGKNVMVVGISASRKMAHAVKGDFSFLDDTPRAATEEEIVKQYGKDSDEAKDNIISVTKLEGVGGNKAIGFGLYPKSENPYGIDKGNTRRNMANIRSERQGIDRLPGQSMPQIEVIDAQYKVLPDIGKIDTSTGEIVESAEVVEEVVSEVPEAKAPAEEAEKEEQQATASLIDLDWLKESIGKLVVKDPKAYSEEGMVKYMRSLFKDVDGTPIQGDTTHDIASKLDKGQAKYLHDAIQNAMKKL